MRDHALCLQKLHAAVHTSDRLGALTWLRCKSRLSAATETPQEPKRLRNMTHMHIRMARARSEPGKANTTITYAQRPCKTVPLTQKNGQIATDPSTSEHIHFFKSGHISLESLIQNRTHLHFRTHSDTFAHIPDTFQTHGLKFFSVSLISSSWHSAI